MRNLIAAILIIFASGANAVGITAERGYIALTKDGRTMYFCAVHKEQRSTPNGLGMRCISRPINEIRATSTECIALPDMSGNAQVIPFADIVCDKDGI